MYDFEKMTREQLKERYEANVAERARLSQEPYSFEGITIDPKRRSSAEAKIAALQQKLAALSNPTANELMGEKDSKR